MSDDLGAHVLRLLLVRNWWRANPIVELFRPPDVDVVFLAFVDAPTARELDCDSTVSLGFDSPDVSTQPHLTSVCVTHPLRLSEAEQAWVRSAIGDRLWLLVHDIASRCTGTVTATLTNEEVELLLISWQELLVASHIDLGEAEHFEREWERSVAVWRAQIDLVGVGTRAVAERPWPVDAIRTVDDAVFFRQAFGRDPGPAEPWPEIFVSLSREGDNDRLNLEMPVPCMPPPGRHITAVVGQRSERWAVLLNPNLSCSSGTAESVRGLIELPGGSLNSTPMDIQLTVVEQLPRTNSNPAQS